MDQEKGSRYARWVDKFELSPSSGKWVHVPDDVTLAVGREILTHVNANWKKPDYFYHLKRGGHVAALEFHLDSEFFATIDIKDFFGHIGRSRVSRFLNKLLRISWDQARDWTRMSVVPVPGAPPGTFRLPFGFPQSPLLATGCLDMSLLGAAIRGVAQASETRISVYMDDLVLSSQNLDHLTLTYNELVEAAHKSKFEVNIEKSQPPRRTVEAFNILIKNGTIEVAPYRISKFLEAYKAAESQHSRASILGYLKRVNKNQADVFLNTP